MGHLWEDGGRSFLMRIVWLSSGILLPFACLGWDVGPLPGRKGGGGQKRSTPHTPPEACVSPPPAPQRVRGLMCLGIRLHTFLHRGTWCELGGCTCVCCVRTCASTVCLPSAGFTTAAEGVCLASTLLSPHPAGQFQRRSLSSGVCFLPPRCKLSE